MYSKCFKNFPKYFPGLSFGANAAAHTGHEKSDANGTMCQTFQEGSSTEARSGDGHPSNEKEQAVGHVMALTNPLVKVKCMLGTKPLKPGTLLHFLSVVGRNVQDIDAEKEVSCGRVNSRRSDRA